MRQIMMAALTGTVVLDGQRQIVSKGVTTAHEGHELVERYPHLWRPIRPDYVVVDQDVDDQNQSDPAAADVRAWAREQGIEVPARGKLPAELVDRYRAAH